MATTYYIDASSATASNQNAGTSPEVPYLSFEALAGRTFEPGDVIALKAGTKYEGGLTIRSSGTEKAPITVTSYGSGDKPVITNSGMWSDGISLEGAHHVVIDGIKIAGAHEAGISIDASSSNNVVRNCEATNVGLGISVAGTDNLVTNNYLHDLNMVVNTADMMHDDYGANGIFVSGSDNEFSYNDIVRAKAQSHDYGHDGGGFEIWGGVEGLRIHDNMVRDSDGFLEIGGTSGTVANLDVFGNRSIDNGAFAVLHNGSGPFGLAIRSIAVTGNVIAESNGHPWSMIWIDDKAGAGELLFNNNVVAAVGVHSIFSELGAGVANNTFMLDDVATIYRDGSSFLGSNQLFSGATASGVVKVGRAGADTLSGGSGADLLLGGDGNDKLVGNSGTDVLFGNDGDDALLGSAGADRFIGGDGADRLFGGWGMDNLKGGWGADYLDGGVARDFLHGGSGSDDLHGNWGADVLYGSYGNDRLFGGADADRLFGGEGSDRVGGGAGDDFLDGGAGADRFLGWTGADTIYGRLGDDVLEGGFGADRLFGGGGADRLFGGAGNDVLNSGFGRDTLNGGSGRDTAVYSGRAGDYDWTKSSDGSWDVVNEFGVVDQLFGIEKLQFSNKFFFLDGGA